MRSLKQHLHGCRTGLGKEAGLHTVQYAFLEFFPRCSAIHYSTVFSITKYRLTVQAYMMISVMAITSPINESLVTGSSSQIIASSQHPY